VRAPLLPLAAPSRNALLAALREVGLIAAGQSF